VLLKKQANFMNYILYDGPHRESLLPFTFTRPVAGIRIGITTISEKWKQYTGKEMFHLTQDYLHEKFPLKKEGENVVIDASVLPNDDLVRQIKLLKIGQALVNEGRIIAVNTNLQGVTDNPFKSDFDHVQVEKRFISLQHPWDIFKYNPETIKEDFKSLTSGENSMPVGDHIWVTGNPELIFIEEGADIKFAYFNTENGPIYIGKNAEVMEGSMIRGPFALCEHATLKMGAKIYEGTTIGPYSKVGGEVNNSVIFGYSSKAHDGYMGNSVIGEWCNLGADTNTSNLKNTYENVRAWSYAENSFVDTDSQFCGLIMGDHSKSGINTMFNTGTVVGVFCNIFGEGYQRNFIPSFSWGGTHGFKLYDENRFLKVAEAVMKRRNIPFNTEEQHMLLHLYKMASIRK
jgi:UDP-N-acetylglucosamine diphosphorylase/glucosamine-1-phosphate N-acetyltransferase